jgi:hypothetical protein
MSILATAPIIRDHLNAFSERIKAVGTIAYCVVEDTDVGGSLQICASFLETLQSESLDLCVLFQQTESELTVFVDLVKGGIGEVLSEAIFTPSQINDEEGVDLANRICEYISSLQNEVMRNLGGQSDKKG